MQVSWHGPAGLNNSTHAGVGIAGVYGLGRRGFGSASFELYGFVVDWRTDGQHKAY